MTDAKFTPGPWEAVGTDPAEGGDWFWISGSNRMIGSVSGPQSDSVQQANAALIASAPEMLECLIQYRDDLKRPPTGDSLERRLERVERLIAKAADLTRSSDVGEAR